MRLYDGIFQALEEVLSRQDYTSYSYQEEKAWGETRHYEVILKKNLGLELGSGAPSVNMTLATTREDFFEGDEIRVYGRDLAQIQEGGPYGRICQVLLEKDEELFQDSGRTYKLLQDLDFVKYKLYPASFMMRTSSQSCAEAVRVSREALGAGLSFEALGNLFIRRYKMLPLVRQVRVSFLTAPQLSYSLLGELAREGGEIRLSLNRFSKGLSTECAVCSIKELCAKIEGLKELHFGSGAL